LDAVEEPVRAPLRAGRVAEFVPEAFEVGALAVGGDLVAVGGLLGEVLGDVADALVGVLGAGEDTFGVDLDPEPGDVDGFGVGFGVDQVQ